MILLGIFIIILGILLIKHAQLKEGFESNETYYLPKTVWIYWDTPDQPKLISDIIAHNQTVLTEWKVHVLNKKTMMEYIDPMDYPDNFKDYSSQAQSDWFRLVLLTMYGGCWLDASIIINSQHALNNLYNASIKARSQLTAFSWHTSEENTFHHPSGGSFPLMIESWFMMAPKGGYLVTEFLNEYEKALSLTFIEYKKTILKKNVIVDTIYDKNDPTDVYLTVYTCIQKVLQKREKVPPIIILKSEDSMFKIRVDCNMDCNCIMNKIKDDPATVSQLPYIKLVSCDRDTKIDISNYFKQIWND